ncbi:hypothetical protein F2Q69_00020278 [Brassica cretica]|uniref:Uncharacterized protein n=1 Tax=Brassica cretica TaxID=69181 RepID=A0A8S9Q8L3_BRACR|nr:hypothetical protein F2Q69_00020278 [Brassica cretica]
MVYTLDRGLFYFTFTSLALPPSQPTQRLTISGFFCPWGVLQRTLRIIVMVPKGRKKKAGLTREDAARDAMRSFDVEERLITVCIRELLEEQEQEQEQRVEDGRDHAGSRSTCLVGCVTETGTQTCQTKDLTITSQTDILDSSPTGVASVIDYASAEASRGFAKHIIEGAKRSGCGGWLSDPDSVSDDDEDHSADSRTHL